MNYLGLSNDILNEQVAGQITKSYQYSPWGERLSMVKQNSDGTKEDSYYGYNSHSDVEDLTDASGNTRSTYGYTAYGKNDDKAFTGVDKPDPANPDKEPYNLYRFNAKRWDPASKQYDMGFRDYNPGLNRFTTRDMYNGALSDMNLTTDPWTMNRYAFGGGNTVSMVELDGHRVVNDGDPDPSDNVILGSDDYVNNINNIAQRQGAREAFNVIMKDVDTYGSQMDNYDSDNVANFNKLVGDLVGKIYSKEGKIDENIHYFRNKLNRAPKTLGEMWQINAELPKDKQWILLEPLLAAYHMGGENGEYDLKYVSSDGHFEAVYNWKGELLTDKNDPVNMGTYNYCGPDNSEGA